MGGGVEAGGEIGDAVGVDVDGGGGGGVSAEDGGVKGGGGGGGGVESDGFVGSFMDDVYWRRSDLVRPARNRQETRDTKSWSRN